MPSIHNDTGPKLAHYGSQIQFDDDRETTESCFELAFEYFYKADKLF